MARGRRPSPLFLFRKRAAAALNEALEPLGGFWQTRKA
jgi:hypothetical protein